MASSSSDEVWDRIGLPFKPRSQPIMANVEAEDENTREENPKSVTIKKPDSWLKVETVAIDVDFRGSGRFNNSLHVGFVAGISLSLVV